MILRLLNILALGVGMFVAVVAMFQWGQTLLNWGDPTYLAKALGYTVLTTLAFGAVVGIESLRGVGE